MAVDSVKVEVEVRLNSKVAECAAPTATRKVVVASAARHEAAWGVMQFSWR